MKTSLSQRYKHPKKQKQNQELQKIKQKNKPQKQKSNNMHSISKQLEFQKNKTNLDGLK